MDHVKPLASVLLIATALMSRGEAQDPADHLTELRALARTAPRLAAPLARRHLRDTSGTWLPRDGVERQLHDLSLRVLRETNQLDALVAELERERVTATTAVEPPLVQVLAGLYEARGQSEIARRLYHEAWQKRPADTWLNLKVADLFHEAQEPERLFKSLSLAWESAPEMVLADAGRVGMWYASLGRTDGLVEALGRLETHPLPHDDGRRWPQFVASLHSGRLSVEQLEPIHRVVMKLAPRAVRPEIAAMGRRAVAEPKAERGFRGPLEGCLSFLRTCHAGGLRFGGGAISHADRDGIRLGIRERGVAGPAA